MRTITALDLRKSLGAILDSVVTGREAVLVTRGHRSMAVLIAPEEYHALTAGRAQRLRQAAGRVAEWRTEAGVAGARYDTVELVRRDRDRR